MTDKKTLSTYDILTDYDGLINSVGQVLEVLEGFEEFNTDNGCSSLCLTGYLG
ncbi:MULTISPECIES: hypothetical protein [unclassified Streptococcus]|uniref:hypothetical protein n=1 Tax=unclassified Streptococcus TaxID=2608887 RepID=UPI00142FAA5A|nr:MULTISPECIES: hypothetical protein [unclassified Streptococcus]MBF0806459.1 hypothetical protein [Streptococcus sp. 19428wA2_WM07]